MLYLLLPMAAASMVCDFNDCKPFAGIGECSAQDYEFESEMICYCCRESGLRQAIQIASKDTFLWYDRVAANLSAGTLGCVGLYMLLTKHF
jgi:hypothetical protein